MYVRMIEKKVKFPDIITRRHLAIRFANAPPLIPVVLVLSSLLFFYRISTSDCHK